MKIKKDIEYYQKELDRAREFIAEFWKTRREEQTYIFKHMNMSYWFDYEIKMLNKINQCSMKDWKKYSRRGQRKNEIYQKIKGQRS